MPMFIGSHARGQMNREHEHVVRRLVSSCMPGCQGESSVGQPVSSPSGMARPYPPPARHSSPLNSCSSLTSITGRSMQACRKASSLSRTVSMDHLFGTVSS